MLCNLMTRKVGFTSTYTVVIQDLYLKNDFWLFMYILDST